MIRARENAPRRARSKGGAEGGVPVPAELMRLWTDYMHEEYRDFDCDFVFVNLWGGRVGRPLCYSNVDRIVERTQQKVGFHFTAHMLGHTYATLAYRDGVQLEVIGALLTHRSPSSTLIYTHPTAEDLREALAERGVLEKVADLVGDEVSRSRCVSLTGGRAPRGGRRCGRAMCGSRPSCRTPISLALPGRGVVAV